MIRPGPIGINQLVMRQARGLLPRPPAGVTTRGEGAGRREVEAELKGFNPLELIKDLTALVSGVQYVVDYELAIFFKLRRERLQPFVPEGYTLFCPDARREHGLMHIGYIRMRPGNLRGSDFPKGLPAFEELTWGVQLQPAIDPSLRSTSLPFTYSAAHLTGTHPAYRAYSRAVDKYPVWEPPAGSKLEFVRRGQYGVDVREIRQGQTIPMCSFVLDEEAIQPSRFALLPVTARVVRSQPQAGKVPVFTSAFGFVGLIQRLDPREVSSELGFWRHPFFFDLFTGSHEQPEVASIMVSRPATAALQILTRAER